MDWTNLISSLSGKSYSDEPILRTAAQLSRAIPKQIHEMRTISGADELGRPSLERLFYQQAKFMEQYTDDMPYTGNLYRYYPTYKNLTTEQLRGYFTWRTDYRQGKCTPTFSTYLTLYAYELLHLIGARSAEDALQKLRDLAEYCKQEHIDVEKQIQNWLPDFVIYYGLSADCIADLPIIQNGMRYRALMYADTEPVDIVFSAMCALSKYNIRQSQCFAAHSERLTALCVQVYRALLQHSEQRLVGQLFAEEKHMTVPLFRDAVFFDHLPHSDGTWMLTPERVYQHIGSNWSVTCYTHEKPSKRMTAIMKNTECAFRKQIGMNRALKPLPLDATYQKILEQTLLAEAQDYARSQLPKIDVDVSKLGEIRREADQNLERLMTEEEREADIKPVVSMPKPEIAICECVIPLSQNAKDLLVALLQDTPIAPILQRPGVFGSMLAEEINAAFYDEIGDVIIEFDGDTPVLVLDYLDDVKGRMQL